jgi:TM2 domain-containing membrane protein YozV
MVTELQPSFIFVNRFDHEPVLTYSGLHGVVFFAWIILPKCHQSIKPASEDQNLRDWALFPLNTGDLTRTEGHQRIYIGLITRNILKWCICISWDSLVSVAIGYGLEGWGWIPGRGKKYLSSLQRPDRLWGPTSQWVPGTHSPRVKRPVLEADHAPSSSAEVKNGGAILPHSHTFSWRMQCSCLCVPVY